MRYVIGIDPGITGAMALLLSGANGDVSLLAVQDMPTATQKSGSTTKNYVVPAQLAAMLQEWTLRPFAAPVDVYIEDVHAMPGQGVTSMFRFGHVLGLIEGVCAGLGLRTHKVRPQEWQTLVRVPKDPDAGRLRACQIFPDRSDLFTLKKHHNRADAALIGYAGARLIQNPR